MFERVTGHLFVGWPAAHPCRFLFTLVMSTPPNTIGYVLNDLIDSYTRNKSSSKANRRGAMEKKRDPTGLKCKVEKDFIRVWIIIHPHTI
jgi:hypothetical protein